MPTWGHRDRSRTRLSISPSNEETRQTTVSLRADDSRGSRYFQTFSYGYNRLRDRFNDNEPYSSENLAGLVRDVGSGTYFVSLLNPAALPAAGQLPPGTRIANATAYFGPYGSLNLTERQTADYQGTLAQSGGALVFGYDFQQQSGNVSGTNASRDHHGFFVNEQYSFGGRLYLSGGARVEHSTAFGTEFVPRGGVSFKLLGEHGAAYVDVSAVQRGARDERAQPLRELRDQPVCDGQSRAEAGEDQQLRSGPGTRVVRPPGAHRGGGLSQFLPRPDHLRLPHVRRTSGRVGRAVWSFPPEARLARYVQ